MESEAGLCREKMQLNAARFHSLVLQLKNKVNPCTNWGEEQVNESWISQIKFIPELSRIQRLYAALSPRTDSLQSSASCCPWYWKTPLRHRLSLRSSPRPFSVAIGLRFPANTYWIGSIVNKSNGEIINFAWLVEQHHLWNVRLCEHRIAYSQSIHEASTREKPNLTRSKCGWGKR